MYLQGFPGGSGGKESACNVGDLGSIPALGRSPGWGHGNPLQYSCLENSMDRGAWQTTIQGVTESDTTEQLTLSLHYVPPEFMFFHYPTHFFSCYKLSPWWCPRPSDLLGLPWWLSWYRIHWQYGRPGFDPWGEKGKATHSSILAWRISWTA